MEKVRKDLDAVKKMALHLAEAIITKSLFLHNIVVFMKHFG